MRIRNLIWQGVMIAQLFALNVFAQEGTKQFMPNASDRLWLEIYRSSNKYFATYGASDKERLYVYLNAGETIHFGMKMASYASGNPSRTSVRVKDEAGNVVFAERRFPSAGTGYISSYNQAVKGPDGVKLNGVEITGGYTPYTYTATSSGNHYIEFETWRYNYGTYGNYRYTRRFGIEFFDVTVTDADNNIITNPGQPNASAGRLWSKGWAFTTTSYTNYPVKANFYVFTADEFVNKVQYEMKPFSFNFVANSYGVSLDVDDNVIEKAQSQDGDLTNTSDISEYRIFLNDPDRAVWQNTALPPPAIQVWFDDNLIYDYDYDRTPQEENLPPATIILEKNNADCEFESVTMFKIVSNIDGFATILLDLDGNGYSTAGNDRALQLDLKVGTNYVLWDFKNDDGTVVANGDYTASATFLGRGPAHFPLYDVESLSGISTYSIRPFNKLGPTLYWDDTQIDYWGDPSGTGAMDETVRKQLTINNHILRMWNFGGEYSNYNGNASTFNSWFNAIDLGMPLINFTVTTGVDKCVNGEAPVLGDIHLVAGIDEDIRFSASDFTDKYYDPNDLPLSEVKVLSLPASGTLYLSGVPVVENQVIAASNLDLITYTPPAGFGGIQTFEFTASNGTNYALQSSVVNLVSNSAPTIAAIADQTICTNEGLLEFPVTVGDAETDVNDLSVIAYSHDPEFVANNQITVTGTGANRQLNVVPIADHSGYAIIYVLVDDGYSQAIEEFALHVGPSVVFSGDVSVCVGGNLTLTAEEVGATYVWKKGETVLTTDQQLNITGLTLADAGTYSLSVAKGGCSITKEFEVSIAPLVSFTGDVDLCVGETLSLSADETVATTYTWKKGGVTLAGTKVLTKNNVTLADAGNDYTLYVEKEGCANTSAPFTVSVINQMDVDIAVTGSQVIEDNAATITVTAAETGVTYSVYDGNDQLVTSGLGSGNDLVLNVPVEYLSIGSNEFTLTGTNSNCVSDLNNKAIVTVNALPVVSSIVIETNEDKPYSANLLTGASDPDGGNLSVETSPVVTPSNGSVVIAANGNYTYTPASNFAGTDQFTFRVCDDQNPGACVVSDVTVTVNAVNDAPVLTAFTLDLEEDVTYSFSASDFTSNYADAEGDALSAIRIQSLPANGSLSLSGNPVSIGQTIPVAEIGNLTFAASSNWNGATSFQCTVGDGTDYSDTPVMLTLNVAAEDDAPSMMNATASVIESATNNTIIYNVNDQLTNTDTDVDGETISYAIVSGNTNDAFDINSATGELYVKNTSFVDFETLQQYSLVIRATDSNLSASDATITINITNSDDDVAISISDASLTEGNTGSANLVFTVSATQTVAADLTVAYAMIAVTATAGTDFTGTTGAVTIAAGAQQTTISVPVIGDAVVENDETFTVTLSNPSAGTISGNEATGTIVDNDQATLTVADASANEGDGTIDFTVTLTGAVQGGVTVNYSMTNGSATGGDDYNNASGSVVLSGSEGETKTISIPVSNDDIVEASENFNISLSTDEAVIDASDTATGTIIDNDGTATLTIQDISINENGSGTFTVSVDKAVQGGFSVGYSFVNGTAIGGTDFVNTGNTLSFAGDKEESKTFSVTASDDNIVEASETFTVQLSSAHPLVNSDDTALGTIIDDDAANVTVADVTVIEGETATFTITLSQAVAGGVDVSYEVKSQTAVVGQDVAATTGTVHFDGTIGEQESFTVATSEDLIVENAETYTVTLSSGNAQVGADDTATGTITDNDGQTSVTVTDLSVDEGNNVTFTLTINKAIQGGAVINYTTANGTATAGEDYAAKTASVTFDGTLNESETITITGIQDEVVEGDETFVVNLSTANALVSVVNQVEATITDNDGKATLSVSNVTFNENGSAAFKVVSDKAVQGGFTVNYSFIDGTAIGGSDFANQIQPVVFTGTADESHTILVAAINDDIVEPAEQFTLQLSSVHPLVDASASAIGQITDNDNAALSISDVTVSENGTATFTVTLDNAVAGGTEVTYSFLDGTATGGSDFTNSSDVLVFVGNQNESQSFDVAMTDDQIVETSEVFTVQLESSNTLVDDSDTATGTITDNDGPAHITVTPLAAVEGGNIQFTLTLDKAVQGGVTINYHTTDGTAVAGEDYTAKTASVTFDGAANESETILITGLTDLVVEGEETVNVELTSANPLVTIDATASATIADDDGTATVTIENIAFNENGSGTFTVSVDKAVQGGFDITYSLSGVTAISDVDYQNASKTISFSGDENESKTFVVSAIDDDIVESSETFTVQLSSAHPLINTDDTATGTITDNDHAGLEISDVTATEGGQATFTVTLTGNVAGGTEVTYHFANGSALAVSDFDNTSDVLSFSGTAGEFKTFTVDLTDDEVVETSEYFTVSVSSSNTLVNDDDTAVGTIEDNDGQATVSVSANVSVVEGEEATVTLTLDKAVQGGFSIGYSTASGTATIDTDFLNAVGTVDFNGEKGETRSFKITTVNNTIVEALESFTVNYTAAHDLVNIEGFNTVQIADNDGQATLTIGDASMNEDGQAVFTVTSDKAVQGGFTVDYVFESGTAQAGVDFDSTVEQLVFTGTLNEAVSFTVDAIDDAIVEATENFEINLSSVSGLVITTDKALGTILDNDQAALTIEDVSVSEEETATFTITLDKEVAGGLDVTYHFSNGTAIGGVDFDNTEKTIHFEGAVGESHSFDVIITDDAVVEPEETYTISVSSSNDLVNVDDEATGTITNNDGQAKVTMQASVSAGEDEEVTITLTLDKAVQGGVLLDFATVDGSAMAGLDYIAASGTCTFIGTAGETQVIKLTLVDDQLVETNEAFNLNYSTTNALVNLTGANSVTITDNDGPAMVSVTNVTVNEGESATITLTLDKAVQGGCDVDYNFTDGTAIGGLDFDNTGGSIHFDGDLNEEETITITAKDDNLVEGNEAFEVSFTASTPLVQTNESSQVTLIDEDTANFLVEDVTVTEGQTATFTVTLSRAVVGGVDVTYRLEALSAGADVDFTDMSGGVLHFEGTPGETAEFTVAIPDDDIIEGNEQFTVRLESSKELVGDDDTALGNITDNDGTAQVTAVNIVSVNEGEQAVVTLTLDQAVQGGVTVDVQTVAGTAGSDIDYKALSKSVVFTGDKGETRTVYIDTEDDLVVEATETLRLMLSESYHLVEVTPEVTISVVDNDGQATLSISDVAFEEGTVAQFTVSADKAVQGGFDVAVNFEDITATGGVDFNNQAQIVHFTGTAGEKLIFEVAASEDEILEAAETFLVKLSSANELINTEANAMATIEDNDAATVIIEDVAVAENEVATFTVRLSQAVAGGVQVGYTFINGTALGDEDYEATPGTLTFTGMAGETVTFDVKVIDDNVVEAAEAFTIELNCSNPGVNTDDKAIGTITDNDGTANITVTDVTVDEDGQAELILELDKAVQGGLDVNYQTEMGTAAAGVDYESQSGTLTFSGNAGEQQKVTVALIDDALVESEETFKVNFTEDHALVAVTVSATAKINDNDGVATLAVSDITMDEKETGNFTLTVDKAVQGGFEVKVSLIEDSALEGIDFESPDKTIWFAGTAGETQTIKVRALDDNIVEATESFDLSLTTTHALVDATATAKGYIADDDAAQVTIEDVTVTEDSKAVFTITLDKEVDGGVDITYSFTDDSAEGLTDYNNVEATIAFAGNENETHSFEVTITDDVLVEGNEAFQVNLSGNKTEVNTDDTATGTILDNDVAGMEVTVSDLSTITAEEGTADNFMVVLTAQPTSDVVVDITGLDETEGQLSATALTFTGQNWDVPQLVKVTGVDDEVLDGDVTYTLNIRVNEANSNAYFKELSALVQVMNTDDEVPNNTPVAVEDAAQTNEDEVVTIDVLANDAGLADGNLSVNVWTQPTNGYVVVNEDRTVSVTPATNFNGEVQFSYEVCDGDQDCSTATVKVTVVAVNDAPVLKGESYEMDQDQQLTGNNLLTNDSDVEKDQLVINTIPVVNVAHGQVVIESDGTFTYTPNEGFIGTDHFTYEVCDNGTPVMCAQAEAVIVVNEVKPENQAPVANDDSFEAGRNTIFEGPSLLANDTDPENQTLYVTTEPVNAPVHGTVVIRADGTFTYTPEKDFVGKDQFTYEVCDDGDPQKCATALVTIDVVIKDTDGDTIPDDVEGDDDVDSDGMPNYLDLDSDGDGLLDVVEGLGDCDEDGVPNFLDTDSCEPDLPTDFSLSKGFSPNGDGKNDLYVIPWLNEFTHVSFEVFNRWGNVVYKVDKYENNWDGMANAGFTIGKELPVGTYFYLITIHDIDVQLNGYIYLNR